MATIKKKYSVQIFNKIDSDGLALLVDDSIKIEDTSDPDFILLRSHNLHDYPIKNNLLAIGRAGAGVNNIPVDKCSERGVVVFNTPGANANAVKELVLSAMLLASRNLYQGLKYVDSLGDHVNVSDEVEKNKSNFIGFELANKKLGVIGLGAIGVLVANDAVNLGLDVYGYDPYISVDRAWGLSRSVKQASSLSKMLSEVDFVTLHMPLNDSTRNFLDDEKFKCLKNNCIVLNFARPEIIDTKALHKVLDNKLISKYVTDFPTNELKRYDSVIGLPHLGASTVEAEKNCSTMVSSQARDFIVNGNVKNSVNFPNCYLERSGAYRITIINKNVPNMVGQITKLIAESNLNIVEMVNKSAKEYAYTIVDVDGTPSDELVQNVQNIQGIIKLRCLGISC
jgi:D-3-phosphoglycerate dehydrogenase